MHHLEDKDDLKSEIAKSDIFVDATALGMGKLKDMSSVTDPSWFHENMVVYDTVYAERETKLMQVAKQANVKHVYNGLGMLLEQGAEAFQLWTGKRMPVDYVRNLVFSDQ